MRAARWHGVVALAVMMVVVSARNDFTQDEDDMYYALGQLYRDSKDALDPHDMLQRPWGKSVPSPASGMFDAGLDTHTQERKTKQASQECKAKNKEMEEDLNICHTRLASQEVALEEEQTKSLQLQKILAKEGLLDLQAFYKRAVLHLWNALELKDAQDILKDGNTALKRQLNVHITLEDLEDLQEYMETERHPHKVDEFLERSFTLEVTHSHPSQSLFVTLYTLAVFIIEAGKSLEMWLSLLCMGFVVLAAWAVVLFVRDIQRELRWQRVLSMMVVVVFFICCLWHWRHMYKVAESRRHAEMVKRGYSNNIPEECKPGALTASRSILEWLKVSVLGTPDICERYFEDMMIDSLEEITPTMVIAETLSKFFFQPLQHLGTESAKLTTNFYRTVPVAYHLHATAMFLGLLVIILFYTCAYGIDFPLGLGGYRPMSRPGTADSAQNLRRKTMEQLKQDRETFLQESRKMLADISLAAQSIHGQGHQPLVLASSGILEAQLERLISHRLETALGPHRASMEQKHTPTAQTIRTVTSTPLRNSTPLQGESRRDPQPLMSQEHASGGLASGDVLLDENGDPTALLVSTDAVHRRVAGSERVRVLPPKVSSRCCSSNNSPVPSESGSPASLKKKGLGIMKMFRSSSGENTEDSTPSSPSLSHANTSLSPSNPSLGPSNPSLSPSILSLSQASTRSLSQAGSDEPDLQPNSSDESFYNRVKTMLDDSANSSSEEGQGENNRRHSGTQSWDMPAPPQ